MGVRNVAILVVLVIGLIRQHVMILFCAYLMRCIVDMGDAINNVISGELYTLLVFIPFFIIPLGYGAWVLSKINESQL